MHSLPRPRLTAVAENGTLAVRLLPAAAAVLRSHDVQACTDVTGFGLAGHLMEMLRASRLSAEILLGELPMLQGASEMFLAGQQSSLQIDNLRGRHVIENLSAGTWFFGVMSVNSSQDESAVSNVASKTI